MRYSSDGRGEFETHRGIFMTSVFIGYIDVMIRSRQKPIVLCVFGFIMAWSKHILMANETDYCKCEMIMGVLKTSAA
jgi:hypothetical protein